MIDVIKMLSRSEIELMKILYSMAESKKVEVNEKELIEKSGLNAAAVKRSLMYLGNKKLVDLKRRTVAEYSITDRGKEVLSRGLPEERLYKWLKSKEREGIHIHVSELAGSGLNKDEIDVSLGKLRSVGAIELKGGELFIPKEYEHKGYLSTISLLKKVVNREQIEEEQKLLNELIKRGFIEKHVREVVIVSLAEKAKKLQKGIEAVATDFVDSVTRNTIVSGAWKSKRFRAYDVESPVPDIWGGRKHPLRVIWEDVCNVFKEMGFKEMRGDWVELVFWNMDAMFIPQDHPARDIQDTFYLDTKGRMENTVLLSAVKEVHETGGSTGSKGWRFPWNPESTMKLILRSHTTCLTYRMFARGIKPPVKYFAIGRVFRNEAIDRFHLPEFHQIEGFVAAEGLTLKDLFGYIKTFYEKMGIKKLRFKPTYNPYTEPSAEIFGYHKELEKWVEVGNSGMFRPESLAPYNINVPVIAWGLALERLAMFVYGHDDIRKLIGHTCDINWLRSYRIPVLKF